MSASERIPVPVERVGNFLTDVDQLYEVIRVRANKNCDSRGSTNGYYDVADWLRAENELVVKPRYKLWRRQYDFVIEMILPTEAVSGLAIRVSPNDLLISSKPDIYGLRIFRIVRFPEIIDWAGIHAEIISNKLIVVAEVAREPGARSFVHFA